MSEEMNAIHQPETVTRCPDLNLSAVSGVNLNIPADVETQSAILVEKDRVNDNSISSSIKELAAFEVLEYAAEHHESFTSNLSYASKIWNFKHELILMPPNLFEENNNDNTLDISEIADQSDNRPASPNSNKFEPESLDSDTDTHSVASISLFHSSLPIIASTPPTDLMRKKSRSRQSEVAEELSDKDASTSYSSSIVRKLFQRATQPQSAENSSLGVEDNNKCDQENHPTVTEMAKDEVSVGNSLAREARLHSARSTAISVGDGTLVDQLQEKLKEIKAEIAKLKTENARAVKSRLEYDAAMKQLEKDRKAFDFERMAQLRKLDDVAREEAKNFEMERKLLYKHFSAQKVEDTRKLAEINQELTNELQHIKEDLKKTESREQLATRRLRDRIKALEEQNDKLRDKIDAIEEDKQELVREIARLTKRNSGKISSPSPNNLKLASSSDPVPRKDTPNPAKEAECWNGNPGEIVTNPAQEIVSNVRPILKTTGSISPPRNVRFDVDVASICSSNEEDVSEETVESNGTIERIFKDGRRVRCYKNGTKKEISQDGKCAVTTFFNGDVLEVLPNKEVYFYCGNQTVQTKYPDGSEVYQFANNQTEKLFPDGKKEVHYPNGTVRTIFPSGNEECRYTDGNVVYWNEKTGTRTIHFSNGEIETHTADWKKREFPDGSEKTVFSDGRSETKYGSGRVRIKDSSGKIIFDSEGNSTQHAQSQMAATK